MHIHNQYKMKTIYKTIILFVFLSFSVGTFAQIESKKKLFFDFRVGLNSSEMDIKDANYDKKIKPGFHFGVVTAYKFYDNIQFQSGIYATRKGLKQKTTTEEISESGSYRHIKSAKVTTDANYILMPLMLGWESNYERTWIFNVNAGVYGAWGFSGKTKERGTETIYFTSASSTTSYSEKYDTFTSTNLKKSDYGLIGSIGVVYDIFTINLNYEYGLRNVSNNIDRELKNRNLSLSLGFRF